MSVKVLCDVGAFGDYFLNNIVSVKVSDSWGGGVHDACNGQSAPCQQNIELQALGIVIVVAIVTEARSP